MKQNKRANEEEEEGEEEESESSGENVKYGDTTYRNL
jgi:hypothetical protein